MILIDAVYVNVSGGKILLDLLIKELEKRNLNVFYLLDYRIENNHPKISKKNKIKFLKGSLLNRYVFYKINSKKFDKILCFGNFPPPIKVHSVVYTYFQNVLLANKTFISIKWMLKKCIFKIFSQNTNYWFVQTPTSKKIIKDFIKSDKAILLYPFFQKFSKKDSIKSNKINNKSINFLYVSTGENYKNHKNLLKAFSLYYNYYNHSSLTLTVSKNYNKVYNLINKYKNDGINIINKGFISSESLRKEYEKADVLIYPSSFESFGLGLIEAAQYKLPIIASNLPYVFDIIKSSHTFDPLDFSSIFDAMKNHKMYLNKQPEIIIENKLEEMINFIFQD